MIGDFWGVEDVFPELDDRLGISAVITFSSLGEKLLEAASLKVLPVGMDQILKKNPNVIMSVQPHPQRGWFFENYEKMGVVKAVETALGKKSSHRTISTVFRSLKRRFNMFKEKTNGKKC